MGENKKEKTMKFSLFKIMIFGNFVDACNLHQCTNCEGWHYEKLPNHHLRLACKYVRQCCIRKYHFYFDNERPSTTVSPTTEECDEYHGCVHVTESAYAKVGGKILDFFNGLFQ